MSGVDMTRFKYEAAHMQSPQIVAGSRGSRPVDPVDRSVGVSSGGHFVGAIKSCSALPSSGPCPKMVCSSERPARQMVQNDLPLATDDPEWVVRTLLFVDVVES